MRRPGSNRRSRLVQAGGQVQARGGRGPGPRTEGGRRHPEGGARWGTTLGSVSSAESGSGRRDRGARWSDGLLLGDHAGETYGRSVGFWRSRPHAGRSCGRSRCWGPRQRADSPSCARESREAGGWLATWVWSSELEINLRSRQHTHSSHSPEVRRKVCGDCPGGARPPGPSPDGIPRRAAPCCPQRRS